MIQSFKNRETEDLFHDLFVARWKAVERPARRKLLYLHRARNLSDLAAPPGNHLEALPGSGKGLYSIRINDPYRICFRWNQGEALDVEIVDYH